MKVIKSSESAQKIYNEFKELFNQIENTEELIKECAYLASKIVYDSGPTTWDLKEYNNSNGVTNVEFVNIKHNLLFWGDVKNQILKLK